MYRHVNQLLETEKKVVHEKPEITNGKEARKTVHYNECSVADPDLQIRGEGGGHLDPEIRGEGGGHLDPEIRGRSVVKK